MVGEIPLAAAPALHARLLGSLEIAVGDRMIPPGAWAGRSSRSLLLLLLGTPDHRLHRDQVLDRLWPDAVPSAALNALYKALHTLRRVLEPTLQSAKASAYIDVRRDTIALRITPGLWIDTDIFESLLAQAGSLAPAERRATLREALQLYRGDFLVDEPYADWPVPRREALRRAREHAVLALATLDLEAGDPLASVPALEMLVAADATIEAGHRALMRAFAAAGQRDLALRQFERCCAALRHELGAAPTPETVSLAEATRSAAAAAEPAPRGDPPGRAAPFDNIPALPTQTVGRERDIDELQALLVQQAVRLVTITGPGGIGKTRLAIETAAGLVGEMPDGVGYISLAAVPEPALVIPAIAQTLGLREDTRRTIKTVLEAHLKERAFLLVLDNFEHVIEAAPGVAELLASCHGVKALVTSREPLRLRGEREYRLNVLTLPSLDRLPRLAILQRFEALALFVQTVRDHRPDFELTEANARAVAELCVRLDGLPLAIELAAARCRRLALRQVLDQIRLRVVALAGGHRDLPGRQRTICDTIAWSHNLLSAGEQLVFRRLAVFAGGAEPDTIRAVCGEDAEALVSALADKSLVQWDVSGEQSRVSMLETIHAFAAEHLAASGEETALHARHARYLLALAEQAEPHLHGPDQADWHLRLEREHDNLRAALAWAVETEETETALRLAAALWQFWLAGGYLSEGRTWFRRALDLGGAPPPLRAKTLEAAAPLVEMSGAHAEAVALLEEAIAQRRVLRDPFALGRALHVLGIFQQEQGDHAQAAALLEEALAHYGTPDDPVALHWALIARSQRGASLAALGDLDRAMALSEEALTRQRRAGNPLGIVTALYYLADVTRARGETEQAVALYREGLALVWEIGQRYYYVMNFLPRLVLALAERGDVPQAVRLAGFADVARGTHGGRLEPNIVSAYEATLLRARAALGADSFEAAWAAGRALSMEQAVAEALATCS